MVWKLGLREEDLGFRVKVAGEEVRRENGERG